MLGLPKSFLVYIFQIILLVLIQSSLKCDTFPINYNLDSFYYSAPQFDIKFANVTFGSARFNSESITELKLLSLGQTIANICQADLINRNQTKFSIDGLINLIYQDFQSVTSSGQAAIITILANNLEGNNMFKNLRLYNANITGFIGLYDYGTAKINSLVTNDFGIPTISAGDLARSSPDNSFSGTIPGEKTTLLQIFDTIDYNEFDAMLDLLKYFNWTLVGNIFSSNNYGYRRQADVTIYSSQFSDPLFACQTIFYIETNTINDTELKNFCKCINEKTTIQIIILWMGTSAAIEVISKLQKNCSASKDWTFIVTEDYQTPITYTSLNENLKNSLLLRANGPWDVQKFLDDCLDGASPAASSIIQQSFQEFIQIAYNCTQVNDDNLEECTSLYKNQNKRCICPQTILSSDPYFSRYLFNADVISTYAEGIRLIANNCTYLNEKTEFDKAVKAKVPDFCKLTTFTPEILSLALRYINITGYTGEIFFAQSILSRSIKNFFLYSAYTDNLDAVLVGLLNSTNVQINSSAIQFVNGQVPTSEVVPQNPDLSYAIVVVFFSISIVEIFVCVSILVYFIAYINNLSMRKISPIITLMMTVGVTIMAIGQFFQSFARTDFFCTFQEYLYGTGFILILSGTLVKTYRVQRIFANRTAMALKISEGSLLLIAALISGVLITLITVFAAIFGFKAIIIQSSSNIYYKFVTCQIPNKTWEIIFKAFVKIYTFIVLVVVLVLAWLTRNVKEDYRETKALTIFAYSITSAYIILIPLSLIVDDETDSEILKYVIEMEFYMIVVLSAISLLFLPQVFNIYRENKKRKVRESTRYN